MPWLPFTAPLRRASPPPLTHTHRVLSAEVHGLQPAAHDKTLFPSDHAAIKATLEVSRKLPVDLQAASGGSSWAGGSSGDTGGEGGAGTGKSSL